MRIIPMEISGLVLFEPKVNRDSRGFFIETFRESWLKELGQAGPFVQDNHARSEAKGVLRGLHFQAPPAAQSKLVWVTRGAVYDVALDLRKSSPTYGRWQAAILSADNFLRFYVPRGFAHVYLTLEEGTEFQYKVDAYYNPEHEGGVAWDDPDLAIPWPVSQPVLSEKDRHLPRLRDFISPFK